MATRNLMSRSAPLARRLRRPQVVWLSLLASMTVVGGLLLALDGGPAPRADGLVLAAAARVATPPSIETIFSTRRPIEQARWKRIVIHHSGAMWGTPESLASEAEARNLRGLPHHFVIGNGAGAANGELYVGYRWLDQLPGAHAAGPEAEWNNLNAISICLVGNGDRREFTPAQLRRLADLVGALVRELGIPQDQVVLHSQIAPTSSPGRLFPESALRESLRASR